MAPEAPPVPPPALMAALSLVGTDVTEMEADLACEDAAEEPPAAAAAVAGRPLPVLSAAELMSLAEEAGWADSPLNIAHISSSKKEEREEKSGC